MSRSATSGVAPLKPVAAKFATGKRTAGKPAKAAVIVIRGRKVVGGVAEGEAIMTHDTISGWGGIDSSTGTIIERRHEIVGQSFKDKVLVFPGAKGSSGYSHYFHLARVAGAAPKAMLFTKMTTKAALGAVVTRVPAMTDFEVDPLTVIRTGDWVKVDADRGVVEITRKAAKKSKPRQPRNRLGRERSKKQ